MCIYLTYSVILISDYLCVINININISIFVHQDESI